MTSPTKQITDRYLTYEEYRREVNRLLESGDDPEGSMILALESRYPQHSTRWHEHYEIMFCS